MAEDLYLLLDEEVGQEVPMYTSSEKMRQRIGELNDHIRSLEKQLEDSKSERLPLIQEVYRRQQQERIWAIRDRDGNVIVKRTKPRRETR